MIPPRPQQDLDERERRAQQQQAQAFQTRQQAAPAAQAQMPQQQPQRITNNYMGPPEAPVQAEEPARAGPTGFVGFGQQMAANQDVAARMAGDAGKAAYEGQAIGSLKSNEGRQALLQKAYGKAAQVTDLDAALAGGAGGTYFQQLEAAYGSEAMARQAQQRRDNDAKAAANQKRMDEQGAAMQRRQREEAKAKKEARIRDEIGRLQRYSDGMHNASGQIRNVTPEQWAAMHGMTLEEWVRNGKNPPY